MRLDVESPERRATSRRTDGVPDPPAQSLGSVRMFSPEAFTSVEICAGAGGQALGLEQAGLEHLALVEYEHAACQTLRLNRPSWNVVEDDLRDVVRRGDLAVYEGVDLLAGGVPCPPFSLAGKQLGAEDDRDLFPAALDLVGQLHPSAVMIENVRGLLGSKFSAYRGEIESRLDGLGYDAHWKLLHASDYGVPQLRPRALMVALHRDLDATWEWPQEHPEQAPTVGDALRELMGSAGWRHVGAWAERANRIAPTLVGGSKKHGGPDLGPTRAKAEWAAMGVDAMGVADELPGADWHAEVPPKLTVQAAAILQGFPPQWEIWGRKTAAYRQVGNAFPPPVARAVGEHIVDVLAACRQLAAA
jgi:DNA (cytosine-5)-methyltransferase 1